MRFLSDPNKARLNLLKHRVSFDEASTVFDDVLACHWADVDHSGTEQRYQILGLSQRGRLLIVTYSCQLGDIVRIISARLAFGWEKRHYWRRI
ncbi:BrnT family toxin [Duganella qianjiadongensis]|uniref:BrnT family toxin n=1 Tax=Duganella qianjiadongensis TaxID=2692176 RepID=A0ABW9VHG7_9BURK|nr:BrnT family toxin [Duganella qianjiadongensis]